MRATPPAACEGRLTHEYLLVQVGVTEPQGFENRLAGQAFHHVCFLASASLA
jgi:hypothetical protein